MKVSRSGVVYALSAVVILLAGCQSKSSTESTPAVNTVAQANEAATRRMMEGIQNGDTTVVDSLVAESFVEHQTMPGLAPDRAGLKAFITQWHAAFPDLQMKVNNMTADSSYVWVYSTMSGTMKGPLMGMKPTGKSFQIDAFDLIRIENAKCVEHWGAMNDAAMMTQLGLGAPPAGGKKRS
ncbi:MAG TPA: ester cyclase [Candidatus Eisenbacteria bacterium]|nr:ester cyclase [Candidatus Eisenbacteria bacterium]